MRPLWNPYVSLKPAANPQAEDLRRRAELALPSAARLRYLALLREWAEVDDGQLPTMHQAVADVVAEYEAVCAALGELALQDPVSVFGGFERASEPWWRLD